MARAAGLTILLSLLASCAASDVRAQVVAEPLLTGLNTPLGVTVDRESGATFVSEAGAGRILRVDGQKTVPVVVGFPTAAYGPGDSLRAGPGALAMIDKQTVVVFDGGAAEGLDAARVYRIPEASQPPVDYAAPLAKLGPFTARGAQRSAVGLGAVAWNQSAVALGGSADEPQGWLYRAIRTGEKWHAATQLIATRELVGRGSPAALATSPRGEVVVGQAGTLDQPGDSLLSFYNLNSGRLLLSLPTGLHDIVAVDYSPKTGQLYALDLAWNRPADAGLYQLVSAFKDGLPAMTTRKIVALERPVALAFRGDGELLIASLGPAGSDGTKSGRVLRVAPGL